MHQVVGHEAGLNASLNIALGPKKTEPRSGAFLTDTLVEGLRAITSSWDVAGRVHNFTSGNGKVEGRPPFSSSYEAALAQCRLWLRFIRVAVHNHYVSLLIASFAAFVIVVAIALNHKRRQLPKLHI